jgi:hypothetical protein
VEDVRGDRIASGTVSTRLNASPLERTVSFDGNGNFRIDDLKPGTYRITVTAQGFTDAVADVPVDVSSVRDIAVTLKSSVISQSVEVYAQGNTFAPFARSSRVSFPGQLSTSYLRISLPRF